MSASTSYVRPGLTATRLGTCEPDLLVDLWLDRLLVVAEPAEGLDPDRAYDRLALWGRLLRCRPELIRNAGGSAAWNEVHERTRGQLPDLATAASAVADPDGWLREAVSLADTCDDGALEGDLAEWAEQLLTDLDDADLVVYASHLAGLDCAALEQGLERCYTWLADNADRFFSCGVFVQALGQAMRPDLAVVDLDLAATADKFIVLLDALEDAETLIAPSPITVGSLPTPEWPLIRQGSLAMAADVPVSAGLVRRRWRSPDGGYRALLVIDPAVEVASVRLNLFRGDESATELAGAAVSLGGCPALVDANGHAEWAVEDLLRAEREGQVFHLLVSRWSEPWTAEQEAG